MAIYVSDVVLDIEGMSTNKTEKKILAVNIFVLKKEVQKIITSSYL